VTALDAEHYLAALPADLVSGAVQAVSGETVDV
jgi:hypothetical protein